MNTKQEMIKLIKKIANRYGTYEVFFDFVQLAALAIANKDEDDKNVFDQKEQQYFDILGKYKKEDFDVFPHLLASLTMELNYYPSDVLGEIFHDLELHNKWKGQFFTPINVCVMMSKMLFGNAEQLIEKQGYITIDEPACGSGAMLIGMAQSLKNKEHDYSSRMLVRATDIDIRCIHMTYVQLSLLGIPAVVIHGNSITMETWDTWETPLHRQIRKLQEKNKKDGGKSA